MPLEVRLKIDTTAGGSWRITCFAPGEAPARARLDLTRVRRLRAELEQDTAPDGRAALATLFESSPAVAGAFGAARGAARSRETSLLLLIESNDPGVGALPWEALDVDPPPDEHGPADTVLVARFMPRPVQSPEVGAGLSTHVSVLHDDTVAESINQAIESTCIRHGLPRPCSPAVALPPDHGSVLHLVVPTRRLNSLLRMLGGAEARAMAEPVTRADLVLVWCAGGSGRPTDVRAITTRLLDLGARACLVPRAPLPLEQTERFLDALYGGMAGGQPLADCVASARRTLTPEDRVAHGGVFTLAGPGIGGAAVMRGERWPEGWPMPGAEAARMLEAAHVLAEQSGSGFLGIEHLALALVDAPPRPALVRLRYQFSARRRQLEARLSGWSPRQTEPARPRPTMRLVRVGHRLTVGFDPEMLWQVLFDLARPAIRVLIDEPRRALRLSPDAQDGDRTEGSDDTVRESAGPAAAIEVVTGPEDGRRLVLAPGEALGRDSGSRKAEHRLYAETSLTDAALSRRHLVWLEDGVVELKAAIIHPRQEGGALKIGIGDLVGLTRCTWLRGVGAESTV